ncbi:MAG: TAXI family TRAP transporter solute-binding subunit [Proteobacteria bacterium]|nr:TAXI family TRAP transporter solute-binding subunit [Pseudomonadota bacterium]
MRRILRLASALALAALAAVAPARGEPAYRLAASVQDGAALPIAAGIARLVTARSGTLALTDVALAEAARVVTALAEREVAFALADGFAAYAAYAGTGRHEGAAQRDLRDLVALFPRALHVLVRAEAAREGTLSDLKTLAGPLNLGPRLGDGRAAAEALLAALGVARERGEISFRGHADAVEALRRNLVSGIVVDGTVPAAAVTQAFVSLGPDRVRLLALGRGEGERLDWRYPGVWFAEEVAPGTYPGLGRGAPVPALAAALQTRADVAEEAVYTLVKAVFDNLAEVRRIHPAAGRLGLASALIGLTKPLHPGAARFYREKGAAIPERILP